jgi:hypothetical protein
MLKPEIIHFKEKPERLKMLKTKMKVQNLLGRRFGLISSVLGLMSSAFILRS